MLQYADPAAQDGRRRAGQLHPARFAKSADERGHAQTLRCVLYQYRIRQADILRENGDLAAAYDTLAPALASRPGDVGAVSALARMYAGSGDNAKAFELYKPLLQRQPNDPQMLLNAADAAIQAHDIGYADRALEQFLKLQIYDPQSLTEAARIYRSMGKSGQATELLRKAVAIEQNEQKRSLSPMPVSRSLRPIEVSRRIRILN